MQSLKSKFNQHIFTLNEKKETFLTSQEIEQLHFLIFIM